MYKIQITKTSKLYGSKEGYRIFDSEILTCENLSNMRQMLKEKYGNCKREKCFRDRKNGGSFQSGWIYCFNNDDISHVPVEKWRQKDWVEVVEVHTKTVDPKEY